MQKAQSISLLAPPRLEACSSSVQSKDGQLAMVFALKGENATSSAKDLEAACQNWQINSPEELHQNILDLLSSVRQQNLTLELALCHLSGDKITFATYAGEVYLKRHGLVKKILSSQGEIRLIVGRLQAYDQIVLSNLLQKKTSTALWSLLQSEISLEKLVGELTLLRQEQGNKSDNLVFVSYSEATTEPEHKVKKQINYRAVADKIILITKKISQTIKKIYQTVKKQGRRKILTTLSIIVGVLLLLAAINSLLHRQQAKALESISEQIAAIKGEATDFSQLLLSQPLEARERANRQLQALQALHEETSNKESRQLIETEIASLEQLIKQISAENSLDQLTIAFNLESFLGQKMIYSNEGIFVLENNRQDILWLKNDQSQTTLRLPDDSKIRDLTISEGKLFVLSTGIWLFDFNTNEPSFTRIKEEGESDRAAQLMASYGPYLYLLNQEKRNIYRYYYNDDQMSEPIGWLVDKQGLSFDNLSDLLVDGDLYLSDQDGQIFKYSRGSRLEWQITGLSELPKSNLLLTHHEETSRLAALEKQARRLLLLTQEGQLISEIKSNELAGVTSLSFDQSGQKIYALSGSVIYEIALQRN